MNLDQPVRDIGWAVRQLRNGMPVGREGWNGKGMFLYLVAGSHFSVTCTPLTGIYPAGTVLDYREHIVMRTDQGDFVPWVCSQSDLLAADWDLVW